MISRRRRYSNCVVRIQTTSLETLQAVPCIPLWPRKEPPLLRLPQHRTIRHLAKVSSDWSPVVLALISFRITEASCCCLSLNTLAFYLNCPWGNARFASQQASVKNRDSHKTLPPCSPRIRYLDESFASQRWVSPQLLVKEPSAPLLLPSRSSDTILLWASGSSCNLAS